MAIIIKKITSIGKDVDKLNTAHTLESSLAVTQNG